MTNYNWIDKDVSNKSIERTDNVVLHMLAMRKLYVLGSAYICTRTEPNNGKLLLIVGLKVSDKNMLTMMVTDETWVHHNNPNKKTSVFQFVIKTPEITIFQTESLEICWESYVDCLLRP